MRIKFFELAANTFAEDISNTSDKKQEDRKYTAEISLDFDSR